eukprot:UN07707
MRITVRVPYNIPQFGQGMNPTAVQYHLVEYHLTAHDPAELQEEQYEAELYTDD